MLKDKIENKALNGEELLEVAVSEFRDMLKRDCAFLRTIAYRRAAFTLSATFHLGSPVREHVMRSHVRKQGEVVEGETPLVNPPEDSVVVALERDVKVENPNLARVHHDLPITLIERMPSKPPRLDGMIPGEPPINDMFPQFETTKIRYEKDQYPAPVPPVDRDVSEKAAQRLGVKVRPARVKDELGNDV
jgi:hypothetical protein